MAPMLDKLLESLARGARGEFASMADAENAVRLAWPSLVGRDLARVSAPLRIDPATRLLEVGVEPRWREALFAARALLTTRVQAIAPRLAGVRLSTIAEGSARERVGATVPPPSNAIADGPGTGPSAASIDAAHDRARPSPDPRTACITDARLRESLDALVRAVEQSRPEGGR